MESRNWWMFVTLTINFALNLSVVNCKFDNSSVSQCQDNNYRYDSATGSCVRICRDNGTDVGTTCKDEMDSKGVTYELVTSRKFPPAHQIDLAVDGPNADGEPIVHIALPACKPVNFSSEEITSITDTTVTVSVGKAGAVTVDEFQLSADNSSVTLCYPLSPQLLQCKLKLLNMANYVTLPGRKLMNTLTNQTVGFSDYYTVGDDVIGCTEQINEARKLRCNYVTYKPEEYRFIDGNVTILLLPTNETIYRPKFTDVVNKTGEISLCYPSSPNFTLCPKLWFLETNEFQFNPDHSLYSSSHQRTYNLSEFFIYSDKRAVVCAEITPLPTFDYFVIHASLYVVSAFCLLVAFVVHLLVPSLNYHAKPLLCHMISLLLLYVSLATRKFMMNIQPEPCYFLFITTYVSALASFFWLNVLAFDLWSIFANLQTSSRLGCRPWACGSKEKRFYYYSAYAWGLPVVLCVLTVVLDTTPSLQDALDLYPRISKLCWFNNRKTAYLLLYGPLFTMLAINITLFVLTVANLRRASKGVEVVNKKLNKQLLFVCFRLFIVMGLCWIVEATTWTLELDAATQYIPDLVMAVQGVIIFIIYICKPTTYRLLRRKFSSERQRSTDTRWTTDYQSSKGPVDRKTSSSGISMNSTHYAGDSGHAKHKSNEPKLPIEKF